MKNIAIFPAVLLLIFCFSCSNNHKSTVKTASAKSLSANYCKIHFDSLMAVYKNIELDWYGELLADKGFAGVYEHGDLYEDDAVSFLSQGHAIVMQEVICLCTMQRLSTAAYVRFCNRLLLLYNQNKINAYTLEYAITSPPSFPHNRIIINNYNNPEVIKLLKSLQNDEKITRKEIKAYIPDILSGKAKEDMDSSD